MILPSLWQLTAGGNTQSLEGPGGQMWGWMTTMAVINQAETIKLKIQKENMWRTWTLQANLINYSGLTSNSNILWGAQKKNHQSKISCMLAWPVTMTCRLAKSFVDIFRVTTTSSFFLSDGSSLLLLTDCVEIEVLLFWKLSAWKLLLSHGDKRSKENKDIVHRHCCQVRTWVWLQEFWVCVCGRGVGEWEGIL